MQSVPLGIKGTVRLKVEKEHLASSIGSGLVDVLSTPVMVLLMEEAASDCVKPYLDEGEVTVGGSLNVKHLSPTPPGLEVWTQATLQEVQGSKLTFLVEAFDAVEKIGEGLHERFVVNRERFMAKALKKSSLVHKGS